LSEKVKVKAEREIKARIDGEIVYLHEGDVQELPLDSKIVQGIIDAGDLQVVEEVGTESKSTASKDFIDKLTEINGIGQARAENILDVADSEDELREILQETKDTPFRSDVEKKLIGKFG